MRLLLDRFAAAYVSMEYLDEDGPLSTLREPAPASSLNWTLELLGDPDLFDARQWALIGAEVRAGADGYLSQTAILWGAAGHAFAVSHQTVAMFG